MTPRPTAAERLVAELVAYRPTVPYGADYQRRPIGGPVVCQDSGRYWNNRHGLPHRGPQRPFEGPLTESWTRPGRVPRWYVWWRLWGEQNGTCATCPGPAEVVDHCHTTGLVRGLLCYDCNHQESLHAARVRLGLHTTERCWFQPFWDQPPASRHSWYWPYENRSTTPSFLTAPPAWALGRTPPRPRCPWSCGAAARGALAAGVLLPLRDRAAEGRTELLEKATRPALGLRRAYLRWRGRGTPWTTRGGLGTDGGDDAEPMAPPYRQPQAPRG
ncbi:endonuclease domain-containing protein [Streptomyces griseus]|uniref:endonuclease domain-containing protein n=1 Tax=Streptomyces griseus TaxID=1911 RepID=UPI00378C380B